MCRYSNFTLLLEVGHNVTLPEKCMNLTCTQVTEANISTYTAAHYSCDPPLYLLQVEGAPVLAPEYVHRSCNCCYHNGSLFPDGARNITMEDGRNASCCHGELVMPIQCVV